MLWNWIQKENQALNEMVKHNEVKQLHPIWLVCFFLLFGICFSAFLFGFLYVSMFL